MKSLPENATAEKPLSVSQQETEKHESTHQTIQEEDPGEKKISEGLEDLPLQDQDDVFDPGKTIDSFNYNDDDNANLNKQL